MSNARRLVHVGSAVVDLVYRIDRLPEPGGEKIAHAFERHPGGGFNAMAAAARAGMPVAYAGPHGTGPNGDLVRAACRAEGIDLLLPCAAGADTGSCVVLATDDAERTFVSHPGAEGTVDGAALAAVALRPADIVFTSGYPLAYAGSRDALAAFVAGLPPAVPFVLDPAPIVADIPPAILDVVLGRATWLSLNRAEARVLAGAGEAAAQIARLLARCPGAEGIVLRAGAEGCRVGLAEGAVVAVPGFAVAATDTNGAGDVHIGAFLAELTRTGDPARAARWANAAAAISTTRPGGAAAPTRAETEAFMTRSS